MKLSKLNLRLLPTPETKNSNFSLLLDKWSTKDSEVSEHLLLKEMMDLLTMKVLSSKSKDLVMPLLETKLITSAYHYDHLYRDLI